jgi:hypothetical protein
MVATIDASEPLEADLETALIDAEKVEANWWARFAQRFPRMFIPTTKTPTSDSTG